MAIVNDYVEQTPSLTLHEVAAKLWAHNEHTAYRALMAYIKERDNMVAHLKELGRGHLAR